MQSSSGSDIAIKRRLTGCERSLALISIVWVHPARSLKDAWRTLQRIRYARHTTGTIILRNGGRYCSNGRTILTMCANSGNSRLSYSLLYSSRRTKDGTSPGRSRGRSIDRIPVGYLQEIVRLLCTNSWERASLRWLVCGSQIRTSSQPSPLLAGLI